MKICRIIPLIFIISCHPQKIEVAKVLEQKVEEARRHQYHFAKLHKLDLVAAKERAEKLAISLEKKKLLWHLQDSKILFQVKEGILAGTHGELLLFPGRVEIVVDGIPEFILIFDPVIRDRVEKKLEEFFGP